MNIFSFLAQGRDRTDCTKPASYFTLIKIFKISGVYTLLVVSHVELAKKPSLNPLTVWPMGTCYLHENASL